MPVPPKRPLNGASSSTVRADRQAAHKQATEVTTEDGTPVASWLPEPDPRRPAETFAPQIGTDQFLADGSSSMEPFFPALRKEVEEHRNAITAEDLGDAVGRVYLNQIGVSEEVFADAFTPFAKARTLEFPFGGGTPLDAALRTAARRIREFYTRVYRAGTTTVVGGRSTILSDLYSGDGLGDGLTEYLAACKEFGVQVVVLGPTRDDTNPEAVELFARATAEVLFLDDNPEKLRQARFQALRKMSRVLSGKAGAPSQIRIGGPAETPPIRIHKEN